MTPPLGSGGVVDSRENRRGLFLVFLGLVPIVGLSNTHSLAHTISGENTLKPLLVGMNNPHSDIPLYPHPPNCAGWRLLRMLQMQTGVTDKEYLRTFDRVNLVDGREWHLGKARSRARDMLPEIKGRQVVMLGVEVVRCFGQWYYGFLPFTWHDNGDYRWSFFPHPSGRNRVYNDRAYVLAGSLFLYELYTQNQTGV